MYISAALLYKSKYSQNCVIAVPELITQWTSELSHMVELQF